MKVFVLTRIVHMDDAEGYTGIEPVLKRWKRLVVAVGPISHTYILTRRDLNPYVKT